MSIGNPHVSLTYSLADQSFARTKSLGILNFSVQLARALARRPECSAMTVLANRTLRDGLRLPPAVRVEMHDRAADGTLGRIVWDQFQAYAVARRTGHDWLLLPKGFASFVRRSPVRLAVFVHDLMQVHYDRHHSAAVSRPEVAYFYQALKASLRRAEIVFTQTEFVRREIEAYARQRGWPVPRVVCSGIGFERRASATPKPGHDLVVLASRLPHKLTVRAVDYMARWQKETGFAAGTHWIGSLPAGLSLPAFRGWRHHARLPEEQYREVMDSARAVLFFSDYEGFGMPPVEAALAGLCPVYSAIPATREVMEGRGCPFENGAYESFAAALNRAFQVSPQQALDWGRELLRRYDWNDTAGRVVGALLRAE
jgi:glycosyltransferase involved in cell wall biosynthesis